MAMVDSTFDLRAIKAESDDAAYKKLDLNDGVDYSAVQQTESQMKDMLMQYQIDPTKDVKVDLSKTLTDKHAKSTLKEIQKVAKKAQKELKKMESGLKKDTKKLDKELAALNASQSFDEPEVVVSKAKSIWDSMGQDDEEEEYEVVRDWDSDNEFEPVTKGSKDEAKEEDNDETKEKPKKRDSKKESKKKSKGDKTEAVASEGEAEAPKEKKKKKKSVQGEATNKTPEEEPAQVNDEDAGKSKEKKKKKKSIKAADAVEEPVTEENNKKKKKKKKKDEE